MIDSPYVGGAERYVSLLVDTLDRRRFLPSLIVKEGEGLDEWCDGHAASGTQVTRLPMNLPFRPHHAPTIVRAIRDHAPHVAHVNMPGPYNGQTGLLAPLARVAGASAVAVTEHLPMVESLWKRALVKRIAYRWVDRVFTVCEDNVRFLRERQGVQREKITVVYNGVRQDLGRDADARRDEARACLGLGDDILAIAMIGSLTRRKGVDVLMQALANTKTHDWRLLLAGDGEDGDELMKMSRDLGLDHAIVFLGHQGRDEVERLLVAADLVVVPSSMEGMPYVILEAMACSTAVVASRVNGIPEAALHEQTALLTPPGDIDSLRTALTRLMSDKTLRREFGRAGRRRFDELFTLERHTADMESAYGSLLGFTT